MRQLLRGFLALLLLLAVACGGSDAKDASSTSTSTSSSSTTSTTSAIPVLSADQVDANASPYCGVWARIRAKGGPALTGDADKDEPVIEAHYRSMVPLTEELLSKSPDEIKDAVKAALAQVQDAAAGKQDAFLAHGGDKVAKDLGTYAAQHCTKA